MRYDRLLMGAGMLFWLTGCSSLPNSAAQDVANRPATALPIPMASSPQIYSTEDSSSGDPNLAERLWDEDFGKGYVGY